MSRFLVGSVLLGSVALMTGCATCPFDDGLVYYSTFDSIAAIEKPVVGPKGRVVGGAFVDGKKGGGYSVAAQQPGALVDLPANFFGPQGTIEFWAKINNPKSYFVDGGDPRFFQVSNGVDFPAFFLEYAANDGGGNSGLHVLAADNWQSSFRGFHSSMEYSKILGDKQSDWHHYMITWDRDAETKMAVYLDGVEQYTSVKFYTPEAMTAFYGVPQTLSFGLTEGKHCNLSKCDYVIDEFKIWSVCKAMSKKAPEPVVEPTPPECTAKAEEKSAKPSVSVVLIDGSVLNGTVKEASIRLNTILGPMTVPFDKIKNLRVGEGLLPHQP